MYGFLSRRVVGQPVHDFFFLGGARGWVGVGEGIRCNHIYTIKYHTP